MTLISITFKKIGRQNLTRLVVKLNYFPIFALRAATDHVICLIMQACEL